MKDLRKQVAFKVKRKMRNSRYFFINRNILKIMLKISIKLSFQEFGKRSHTFLNVNLKIHYSKRSNLVQ